MANFDWRIRKNHGNILNYRFWDSKLSGCPPLNGKRAKIVINDQVQVNGGSTSKYPGHR